MMFKIFSNSETLSQGIAELFATTAEQAVACRGRFSVLVSGGETPRRTYELLAREPFRQRIPWNSVHLFWGDERCVAASDPRSNAQMVRRTLLDKVPLPEQQIHPIICDTTPQTAASAYETVLRSHFTDGIAHFDLVMLGLGDDGHTASLFPGSGALNEQYCWVTTAQKPGEDIMRVTLTAQPLNQAELVVFLVAGTRKSSVLRKVLERPHTPDMLPAQLIKPVNGRLLWYVDESAARFLTPGKKFLAKER
jgi:6-phosphogluconolactonase